MAEEKQVTEPAKALPALETADTPLSGSSNENVQTNGISDDGQSVSSTDNLVNNCTDCQYTSTKEEMVLLWQLIEWDLAEERDRNSNVCVLLRFKKEATVAI